MTLGRRLINLILKAGFRLLTRVSVQGRENVPRILCLGLEIPRGRNGFVLSRHWLAQQCKDEDGEEMFHFIISRRICASRDSSDPAYSWSTLR